MMGVSRDRQPRAWPTTPSLATNVEVSKRLLGLPSRHSYSVARAADSHAFRDGYQSRGNPPCAAVAIIPGHSLLVRDGSIRPSGFQTGDHRNGSTRIITPAWAAFGPQQRKGSTNGRKTQKENTPWSTQVFEPTSLVADLAGIGLLTRRLWLRFPVTLIDAEAPSLRVLGSFTKVTASPDDLPRSSLDLPWPCARYVHS
jgi:hypothetical protein